MPYPLDGDGRLLRWAALCVPIARFARNSVPRLLRHQLGGLASFQVDVQCEREDACPHRTSAARRAWLCVSDSQRWRGLRPGDKGGSPCNRHTKIGPPEAKAGWRPRHC